VARAQQAQLRQLRVEELKFKINELEQVLQQERADRETVITQQEQIAQLEGMLLRERREKDFMALKLKQAGVDSGVSCSPISGLESPTMSESEQEVSMSTPETSNSSSGDGIMATDPCSPHEQKLLQPYLAKIAELEARGSLEEHQMNKNFDGTQDLLTLQTEISVLKSDNKALTVEKVNAQGLLRQRDEDILTLRKKIESLQTELSGVESRASDANTAVIEASERATVAEKTLTQKNAQIEEQKGKIEKLSTSLATVEASWIEDQRLLDEVRDEFEKIKTDRDELHRQVQAFQVGRKHIDKQMSVLERENRRSKRLITALETSLQDLKISLEEKAMENDELNRSILKVMEHANETIEGAKRHSMVVTSPLLNGNGSPDGSRSSRASLGETLFPAMTNGSSLTTSPRSCS
jgi:hypothetical protein